MAKEKKKRKEEEEDNNPENEERKRLKKLALCHQNLSEAPAKGFTPLCPSKTVIKHHGSDILKKSQRKNRYLLSFSGLIAPLSGGRIGELTHLASKNPILYLDFPQGRMKLLGTIVYPKNRYLTLQFSRTGKNVICEDCFDTMIVFSDAYWVGKKDENPEEARLDFPKGLHEEKQSEFSFQGGAGATAMKRKDCKNIKDDKVVARPAEEESLTESPVDAMESESPVRQDNLKATDYTTPVRHSARMAGKRFKFTEVSSGDDSAQSPDDMSTEADDGSPKNDGSPGNLETAVDVRSSEDIQLSSVQAPVSRKKESSRSSLVQSTISTLFKKVEQKNTAGDFSKMASDKDLKTQLDSAKSKIKNVQAIKVTTKENVSLEKAGERSDRKKRKAEVVEVEDDIEVFSDVSRDSDESDDNYEA